MKPVFLKAGIPLAITVAGFVFARLATRKATILTTCAENQTNSTAADAHEKHNDEGSSSVFESLDSSLSSSSSCCLEDAHSSTEKASDHQNSELTLHDCCQEGLEEEILDLRNQVQNLQEMELELEARYLRYTSMKEQELVVMELQNKLFLEISKVDFLDRELLMVEAEMQRFENIVFEYLEIMELLEASTSENRLLQRRVKKLLRKKKEQSSVINEKCLLIDAKEEETSRNYEEMEKMANVIRKMEGEIEQLKMFVDKKQIENNALLNQIELANKAAASPKVDTFTLKRQLEIVMMLLALQSEEEEETTEADFGVVVSKLEQLEKERADEVKELIYLRWCNACLRHDLLRRNQEEKDHEREAEQMELHVGEIAHFGSDNELDCSSFRHGDSCLGFPTSRHAHSRRRKLIQKFKRWMEGSEKTKQTTGRHSVPNSVLDLRSPARKSYSSA